MPDSRPVGLAVLSSLVASSRRWLWLMAVLLILVSFGSLKRSGAVVQQASLDKIASSASFEDNAIAPGSLATIFGAGLAAQESPAAEPQTQLADRRVEVNGRAALLFYVSPTQINFLVPQEVSAGNATVSVRATDGTLIAARETRISAVAPAIFNLNNVALGSVSRYKADGAVTGDSVGQADAGGYRTKPIDLAVAGDRVFLVFFLTGLRNANPEAVQVLLENEALKPAYAGPVPGLLGLDQINLELPPRLADKGVLNLTVVAPAGPASNAVKIEFSSGFSSLSGLRLSKETLLAGETIEIMRGTNPGDSALPTSDVEVLFAGATGIKPDDAQSDKLTLRVPFGSESGPMQIKFRGRIIWTSPTPIRLRTSISGIVENADKIGVQGMLVRLANSNIFATTNKDGAFVLADVPSATRQSITIDSAASQLPYPQQVIGKRIFPDRDNQFEIERLTPISPTNPLMAEAAEPTQTNPITLELSQCPNGNTNCPFTLTTFARGRTPVDLPVGTYSSAIAQITPFGQPISPGGRLRFQNLDNIPAGTPIRVYKFDQTRGSETLGQFVDIGAGSFNGQFLETAAGAVNEGGYYFISRQWPTATVYGRVVEPDGVRPVRRAIISARGQSVFTDGNGSFVLRNIPVITAGGTNGPVNAPVTLDVTFHRADGSVARSQSSAIPISDGDVKLSIPSALKLPPLSLAPVIVAPEALTIYENELRNFNFLAVDPANDTALTVSVAPTSLSAQVLLQGNGLYTLRLNPGANTAGSYPLTLSATNNQQQTTNHVITVTVLRPPTGLPIALDQTVTTAEGQQVSIILTGSNVGSAPAYEIVTPPARGTLTGTGANQRYTPAGTFNGTDGFTFKVRNGNLESNIARVTIAVRPRNHAPTIVVPAAQMASAGQEIRFLVTANDIDPGQTLTATMSDNPTDATFAETSPGSRQWEFSWRPRYVNAGGVTVRFTVTDNGVGRLNASATVTISVDPKWAKTSGPEGLSIYFLVATERAIFADRFRSNNNGASWTEMNFQPRAVAALNNNLFVTGAPNGLPTGVFRSTDDGQTWTRAFDLSSFGGFFPLTVSGSTLVLGTNNGIYRSTDGGVNWQQSGLGGVNIARLAANGGTVLACTQNGNACYRSSNAGQSWGQVESLSGLSSLVANGTYFIGGKIFNGGIFRLSNTGQNWQAANNGISNPDVALIQAYGLSVSGATIYAGIESLGLFRSDNNGDLWTRVPTPGLNNSIFSTAALGTNLFLGTRLGVHRGTGALTSFPLVNSGITNAQVRALVAQGSTLLAGTYARGLFRSFNNGQSWERAQVGNTDGLFFGALAAVGNTFYAGWYDGDVSLQRSADGGTTWTKFTNGFSDGFTSDIAVGALSVDGTTLYAGTSEGIYRLRSGATSWESISNSLPRSSQLAAPNKTASLSTNANPNKPLSSGRFDLSRNSKNAFPFPIDGVFLSGIFYNSIAASGDTLFASYFKVEIDVEESRVFRSRNGGASWEPLNTGLPPVELGNFGFNGTEALIIRGGFAYAGTPRGVYRIALNGQQWTEFNLGLGTRKVYSFAVLGDRNTGQLYAGTSNGVYKLAADEQTWLQVNTSLTGMGVLSLATNGDGSSLLAGTEANAVHRLSNNTQSWSDITTNISTGLRENVVRTVVMRGTTLYAGTVAGGVYASTNGGQNWSSVNQGLPSSANVRALVVRGTSLFAAELDGGVYELPLNANAWTPRRGTLPTTKFNTLFANGAQLLVGTDVGVFLSNNGGVSWQATGSFGGQRVLSLSVSRDGGTLLAGTSGGAFYSLNNGGTWTAATGLPATVNALIVGGSNARIFAGTDDRGIYRSDDGGFSWAQVNNRIPANLNVQALATNGALVFAGSVYGVFRTSDDGATWEQINAGLTDTFATALTLSGDDLIAGTIKGGVFLSKLSSDPRCQPNVTGQPVGRVVSAGQTAQLQVTATSASAPAYQWYRGLSGDTANPIPGATRASYTTGAINAAESYWVLVSNACGTVSSETATIVVNTPPRVDLALTQTITPVQARPGDDVSFTLNVTNRGQDAAFAVTVTDALPSQVTLTSCEATGGGVCGGAGNNRTVTFASLAAGASATITLRAKVNVGVSGVVRNTASAGAGAGESDLLNNLATASLTVAPADPNAPFISALSPATATAGGAGFTLTVNGANFVSGAQVRWNGGARQTAFGSATLLTAQIPASDIATAGTAQVTVVNPNGNVSNAAGFAINAPQLTPTLTTLIPNSTQAGGAAFTLTLLGTNFAGSAQVRWNGSTRQTVFGSSTLLTAQIPATDIATAGTAQVTVDNSNGNVSGPLTFTISAQPVSAPTLTILSPNSAAAGGAGFTLTVNGTNFVSGAQVRWNGAARATSFVSATQLTAQISAADVANAGVANVTVVAAGGATSNVLPFSINSVTACTYAVTPTFRSFSANGGTATATVTAPAGCEWSVQSLFFGASITSGSSGSGNGTVTFSVAANTTGFGISGSLLIAGQYVLMTQSSNGGNCPPESFSIGGNLIGSLASGDCRSIFDDTVYADLYTFTGQAGQRIAASLTASSFDTFLVLIGPTGTVVDFNDDDVGNNSRIPRGNEFLVLPETGTYLLEVSSFNSNATGVYSLSLISTPAGGVCSYAVTPSVITVGAAGGTATVNVSTTNTCGWTARSSFAQISSGSSGFGSGTVGLSITANTSASRRVGSVLVAGQYVPVIQSGNANDCTVASLSIPQTVNGSLSATDCRALVNSERYADVYTFTGRAGQRIAVTMSSAGYDTYLSLLGTNGDFVAVDDNGGGGTNSRIPAANGYFVLPYTGLYILEAREIFSSDTGDYTLSLTTASDSVACNFALTPTNRAFTATGGTGTISVTSTSGCNWAAESSVSWLTIVGANTGSGNGVVNFTAATNNGPARTGTLLVAGQVFTVTQEGGCTFTISPTSQNLSGDGGSGTVNVTAGAGCTWTATSNAAWLMIAAGTSGSGAASVAFVAAANPNTTPRTGTLTVAGQTFTVTQAALQCSYAISPASQSFNATGGNGSVNVTAPNGCAWTAASNDSWITINSGATSSGNGAVSFTVAANTGGARNGSLLIVGQVFAVSQDSGCTFTISPTSQTLSGGSGSGTVNVTAATGCTWTAVSNAAWLTITAGASGSGAGAVTFTAASNPTTVSRTGTLTIAGQTFSAIQAAGSFPPTISSLTPNAAQAGGVGFALTVAGTNFVAGSKVRWNGGERPTTFGSATQLTAQIPAADIATAGSATVTVANPDGSISAGANFTITPPPQTNRLLRVVASNNQGSTVAVPIELISQGDENAVGFSLTFDPAVLGNPQASLGSDAAGGALNQSSAQAAQGRLGLVLALPAGQRFAAGTRQIAVINFTVAAGDSATTANINFGDQPVAREVSDVNGNVLPANYAGGAVTITRGFEADVAPRPSGNGTLSVTDWVLVGRFASGDLAVEPGSEFQRTDCAPRSSFGNGAITVSDWVQAGRYAAGLDPLTSAAGPTAPGAFAPTELSAFLKPSGWPRLLRLSSPTFGAGQTSAVTIELLAQGEENAVGFSLQFDSRQWRFVSATLGEDAQKAALSVNAKFAADGHVGFALALPPGQKFDAGMRSLVTVNFVAAENGSGFAPEVSFSDWPAARELADAKADVLAADWMPAAAREPANVSSASLAAGRLARGSLATAFGNGLAVAVQQAEAGALPKTLAGTSVTILDSAGAELVAPLFFVSPGQVNYLLPAETATGRALVRIVNGDGVAAGGLIEVVDVAPGLFATDASGKGLAAALALRVKADGSLSYEAVSRFDAASGRAVPVSIDLGNPAEQVFLILFGTGFRGRSSLAVTLQVGGLPVEASYVGPQGEFAGLDQINLALPRALAGRGEVTVNLTVDGKTANSVTIAVK